MMFLENIINKMIELDDNAKAKIREIKEKEENIETYISERLEKEKEQIDTRFAFRKKNLQEKYDVMLEEEKMKLEEKKKEKIKNLQEKYEQEKDKILEELLREIV